MGDLETSSGIPDPSSIPQASADAHQELHAGLAAQLQDQAGHFQSQIVEVRRGHSVAGTECKQGATQSAAGTMEERGAGLPKTI